MQSNFSSTSLDTILLSLLYLVGHCFSLDSFTPFIIVRFSPKSFWNDVSFATFFTSSFPFEFASCSIHVSLWFFFTLASSLSPFKSLQLCDPSIFFSPSSILSLKSFSLEAWLFPDRNCVYEYDDENAFGIFYFFFLIYKQIVSNFYLSLKTLYNFSQY